MEKLSYLLIACVFVLFAGQSMAQKKIIHKRAAFSSASPMKRQPLIVVNGTIFKGDLKTINPNDIQDVHVMKGTAAKKIYGEQGAVGVLLITTKAQAQATKTRNALLNAPALASERLIIVDGELSEKKLNEIDSSGVFSIDSITREKATEQFSGRARNGVVLVITKAGAIKRYQQLLSAFSPPYKTYVEKNNGDKGVFFVLRDGSVVEGECVALLKEFAQLKRADVKSVIFNQRTENATGYKPASVSIEFKSTRN